MATAKYVRTPISWRQSIYNMDVSKMVLGVVHPLRVRGQLIEVPRLKHEMELLVETEISAGRASHPQSSDTRFPAN